MMTIIISIIMSYRRKQHVHYSKLCPIKELAISRGCDHYFWLANNYSKGNEIVVQ